MAPTAISSSRRLAGSAGSVLVLVVALGCTRTPVHQGPPVFELPEQYHVGLNPTSILTADLNGDGRPDLITTNLNSNNVSVLLGKKPSANPQTGMESSADLFTEHVLYDVGVRPRTAALGDFNRDRRLDLAVANNQSDNLSILLGDGKGAFRPATTLPAGRSPLAIAAGDLNGDGTDDLVVALRFDHLLVYLGHGDGTFSQPADYDPGDTPTAVLLADLNGDGHPDVVVSNNGPMTSSVTIFWGSATGELKLGPRYAAKERPIFSALGRVNDDAYPDLVAAIPFSNSVLVFFGDGHGPFAEPPVSLSAEVEPVSVTVGDFNGDGHGDLAIANSGDSTISVLLGDGTGRFKKPQTYRAGSRPMALVAVDLNGDGLPDLAVANNSSSNVSVLMAIPAPTPSAEPAPGPSSGNKEGDKDQGAGVKGKN
ncbi:MAG TPA: VCBS repeat-containing protein [Nitrospiria bacterium]|nr:VCBS repeat-containing protein [Nitrospiria bacterium]